MNLYPKQRMHAHAASTLKTLNTCRKNNFLCDFTIIVNTKAFRLHRVVLASCSEYFNAMFSHDTKELRDGFCRMADMDAEAVRQCIEFMYTGEATPTLETAQPVLHASCLLHLDGLSALCFEKLMDEICLNNCLIIKRLAHTYNSRELEKAADEFALKHFDSVVSDVNFVDLSVEDLIRYIKSSDIQISSVISLWRAAMKWITHEVKIRKRFFCELLQHLKLEDYPEDFMRRTVWNDHLVQESLLCKSTVAHALFKQVMDPGRKCVVNIKSCLFIKDLSQVYSCQEVEDIADRFVLENFDDIVNEEPFNKLEKDDVIRYLRSSDLHYSEDINLWKAVVMWVKHDLSKRGKLFPELLQYVKLEKMPAEFLQGTVRNEPLVKISDVCKDMLMDALFRQVSKAKKPGIAVIDRSSKVLKCYDPASGQWNDMENVKMGFSFTESGVFAVVVEDSLFVLIKKALYKINFLEKQSEWIEMTNMFIKRDLGAAVAKLGRFIYVVDGRSIPISDAGTPLFASKATRQPRRASTKAEVHLYSCGEYYDSLLNSWAHIPEMPTQRANGCLATANDVIYLLGGKVQGRKETNWLGMDTPVAVVECYDPIAKSWTAIAPMKAARYDAASAVLNSRIFVMGGVGQHGRINDVEVYDTLTKTWSGVEGMSVPRSHFSACVVDRAIYVIGGDYRKDAYDKTIECFDLHKRKWEVVKKLNMKIYDNSAVVVSIEH